MNEMLKRSDIISIHAPITPKSRRMVNVDFMQKMKRDGVLINTSHADIVDEDVLFAKLEACPDFWFGTDVYSDMPTTS